MTKINPYLNFDGLCREAMTFYQQCLGGELVMQRIAESPMAAQMPSEMGSKILHSSLVSDEFVLMASDMIGERTTAGNTITLCIHCSNADEIHSFFDKLAMDGKIVEPLHQTFWGATFGKLTDRFGIHWMFNYTKN